mmetsp:Transcript_3957/g.7892  ORF Transcript_3957/g.7892 Transcript_3957/m.7892 type:complete len:110 (-) Transcript_3957:262-591(-)
MTRPIFFLVMALAWYASFAFVPILQGRTASTSTRFLHPDQAKELEQCASDMLKQAMEGEAESALMTMPHEAEGPVKRQRTGPWAWCVEHLSKQRWLAARNASADEGVKP